MSIGSVFTGIGLRGRTRSLARHLVLLAAGMTMSGIATAPAYASSQNGKITNVAYVGTRVLFWISGGRTGTPPSCVCTSSECTNRWEIFVGDPAGQAAMSLVMTAYASGRPVTLLGSGACVVGGNDTEGVAYIQAN